MTLPFYPFYWGDYSSKTLDLTVTEHGMYFMLLAYIYCTGERIPHERRYNLTKPTSQDEQQICDRILERFFIRKGDVWINKRAEEIMKEQHRIHQANVIRGKKGGRPAKVGLKSNLSSAKVEPKQPEPEPIEERKKEPTVLSKEKRGTRIPDDFEPDASCHELAEKLLLTNQDCQGALENFIDYWRGVPGAKGLKLDWQATFRNQLRHVAAQKGRPNGKAPKLSSVDRAEAELLADIDEHWRRKDEAAASDVHGDDLTPDVPRLRQVN